MSVEEQSIHHAVFAIEDRMSKCFAFFRQFVMMMLETLGGFNSLFYDTVRTEETVLELVEQVLA